MEEQNNKSYQELLKQNKQLKRTNLVLFVYLIASFIIVVYNAFFGGG